MGLLEEVAPRISYGIGQIWETEVGVRVESQARGGKHPVGVGGGGSEQFRIKRTDLGEGKQGDGAGETSHPWCLCITRTSPDCLVPGGPVEGPHLD